jgi:serine/threonine protein kinase
VIKLSSHGYEILQAGEEFSVCRARRDGELSTVLVVAPVSKYPALESLAHLENEYSFRDELDLDWAARPLALTRSEGRTMLVLEDPGGEPLDRLLGQPMELGRFLHLAINLAAGLGKLHCRDLIHKDIKPAHILVDSATNKVWFTGFGIASRLPRERQAAEPPEVIAGTLAYMAPEQTGRMNRSIDSRSDLYSQGITLYQMLTGVLPFQASDPMEWVHCHVARQPATPASRQSGSQNPFQHQRTLAPNWIFAVQQVAVPVSSSVYRSLHESSAADRRGRRFFLWDQQATVELRFHARQAAFANYRAPEVLKIREFQDVAAM